MKNNIFSLKVKLLAAALVLVCGVALTGCKPNTSEPLPTGVTKLAADNALIGNWNSSYGDGYTITTTTMKYNDSYGYNWTGTVIGISTNCIYYKFTEAGSKLNSSIVGKYGATAFETVSSTITKFSDATAADYSKGAEDTIDNAVQKLTAQGGYYSYFGTYTKAE